jgi:hypothetical protein
MACRLLRPACGLLTDRVNDPVGDVEDLITFLIISEHNSAVKGLGNETRFIWYADLTRVSKAVFH